MVGTCAWKVAAMNAHATSARTTFTLVVTAVTAVAAKVDRR